LPDAVATDTDIPVVEVDGRVAMAGDQPDLVAEPEPVGGGRDREAAMLVGGALIRAGSSQTSGGPGSKAKLIPVTSAIAVSNTFTSYILGSPVFHGDRKGSGRSAYRVRVVNN
jgi:hypothetical protein